LEGFWSALSGLRAQSRPEQLQQIVGLADDLPFRRCFFQTSHRETPLAPHRLDLAEYRFHRRFAHLVDCLPASALSLSRMVSATLFAAAGSIFQACLKPLSASESLAIVHRAGRFIGWNSGLLPRRTYLKELPFQWPTF
jgi:hypothetical protein